MRFTILSLAFLAVLGLSSCKFGHSKAESKVKWSLDIIPGHEHITRYGVDLANQKLQMQLFPVVGVGDLKAGDARNPLIRGNYATDQPNQVREIQLVTDVNGRSVPVGDTKLRYLHFIRSELGGNQISRAQATCQLARDAIKSATVRGLDFWARGSRNEALFYFGHATHTLQDSFAGGHARRTPDMRKLVDLCTYGVSVPDVCRHGQIGLIPYDENDRVVRFGEGCRVSCDITRDCPWECMKPNANAASLATAAYLFAVGEIINGQGDVATNLTRFFDDETYVPEGGSGWLGCDGLAQIDAPKMGCIEYGSCLNDAEKSQFFTLDNALRQGYQLRPRDRRLYGDLLRCYQTSNVCSRPEPPGEATNDLQGGFGLVNSASVPHSTPCLSEAEISELIAVRQWQQSRLDKTTAADKEYLRARTAEVQKMPLCHPDAETVKNLGTAK